MSISAGPTAPPTVLFVVGNGLRALDVIHPVQMRGYLTLEISTSMTAFSVLENYEIDLAIVDLDTCDGLDGPRMATEIAANWPDVPMIVCAGSARTMQKCPIHCDA
ncbi:hypothetical protein [Rhizobium sp.]|uniref:hypothetical protein n=1 Tax=Rhizobium sp. TaxID=391 RepID=UPI002898631B